MSKKIARSNVIKKDHTKRSLRGIKNMIVESNGIFLCAVGWGKVSLQELEAVKKMHRRLLGKQIKIRQHVFASVQLLTKPAEVRMGKGKGSKLDKKVAFVKPGQILFSYRGVHLVTVRPALASSSFKLNCPVKILSDI